MSVSDRAPFTRSDGLKAPKDRVRKSVGPGLEIRVSARGSG